MRPIDPVERALREKVLAPFREGDGALKAVHAALWLQHLVTQDVELTVAVTRPSPRSFRASCRGVSDVFDKMFATRVRIPATAVYEAVAPLVRFVAAYPTAVEIEGDEALFVEHPDRPGVHGIHAPGLGEVLSHVRCFWCRRAELTGLRWKAAGGGNVELAPASDGEVARAYEISKTWCSACSTDEFLAGLRNRVIARLMPKRTLYDRSAETHVRTKNFYLAMRETDSASLNAAHRAGSVPVYLALDKPQEHPVTSELALACVLLKTMERRLVDDTYADSPAAAGDAPSEHGAMGFFCGEYVLVEKDGVLVRGAGSGPKGIVAIAMRLMQEKGDTLSLDFVAGRAESFRPEEPEDELRNTSCF